MRGDERMIQDVMSAMEGWSRGSPRIFLACVRKGYGPGMRSLSPGLTSLLRRPWAALDLRRRYILRALLLQGFYSIRRSGCGRAGRLQPALSWFVGLRMDDGSVVEPRGFSKNRERFV